jgi:hypothetical protein
VKFTGSEFEFHSIVKLIKNLKPETPEQAEEAMKALDELLLVTEAKRKEIKAED